MQKTHLPRAALLFAVEEYRILVYVETSEELQDVRDCGRPREALQSNYGFRIHRCAHPKACCACQMQVCMLEYRMESKLILYMRRGGRQGTFHFHGRDRPRLGRKDLMAIGGPAMRPALTPH